MEGSSVPLLLGTASFCFTLAVTSVLLRLHGRKSLKKGWAGSQAWVHRGGLSLGVDRLSLVPVPRAHCGDSTHENEQESRCPMALLTGKEKVLAF